MNPYLSLIIWFVFFVIIFFLFWYFCCFDSWKSLCLSVLFSLIVLLIIFPWNLEHHERDQFCSHSGQNGFYVIIALSIVVLIGYILTSCLDLITC